MVNFQFSSSFHTPPPSHIPSLFSVTHIYMNMYSLNMDRFSNDKCIQYLIEVERIRFQLQFAHTYSSARKSHRPGRVPSVVHRWRHLQWMRDIYFFLAFPMFTRPFCTPVFQQLQREHRANLNRLSATPEGQERNANTCCAASF